MCTFSPVRLLYQLPDQKFQLYGLHGCKNKTTAYNNCNAVVFPLSEIKNSRKTLCVQLFTLIYMRGSAKAGPWHDNTKVHFVPLQPPKTRIHNCWRIYSQIQMHTGVHLIITGWISRQSMAVRVPLFIFRLVSISKNSLSICKSNWSPLFGIFPLRVMRGRTLKTK